MSAISLQQVFAPDGLLSKKIPSYRLRPQQIEMAERIGEAIREQTVLVAEAGTGTGKTAPYFVPALLSGGKVIISPSTKTLQASIYTRELPAVTYGMGVAVRLATLN